MRQAFLLNLAIYSVFSLIGGLSPNATILVLARFIAGLGLGAELALADAYLSDVLPPKVRGRYIAWAYTTAFLGIPAAGFLARWLVPLKPLGVSGWRWMFFIGALGAILVWVLRRALPESPRWLESVGRSREADRIVTSWEEDARRSGAQLPPPQPDEAPLSQDRLPVRVLFTREYARRTFMQWTINGLEVFGYYGFGTLAPLVLLAKGYSVVSSLSFLAFVYIGYPIGSALSLPIIERMERKVLIAAGAAGMAITGLLFGYAPSPFWIVLWGFLFTVISNTFSNAFHVYLGEIYPTAVRATAAGAAYSVSRIVTAALPYILIPVLDHSGGSAVFTVVAIALGLLIVDVLLLGPRTTGRALEAADRPDAAERLEPRPHPNPPASKPRQRRETHGLASLRSAPRRHRHGRRGHDLPRPAALRHHQLRRRQRSRGTRGGGVHRRLYSRTRGSNRRSSSRRPAGRTWSPSGPARIGTGHGSWCTAIPTSSPPTPRTGGSRRSPARSPTDACGAAARST